MDGWMDGRSAVRLFMHYVVFGLHGLGNSAVHRNLFLCAMVRECHACDVFCVGAHEVK